MMKKRLNRIILVAFVANFLFFSGKLSAQDITAPFFIIEGGAVSDRVCATPFDPNQPDEITDQRAAIATANLDLDAGTMFYLEISDEDGVFSNENPTYLTSFQSPFEILAGDFIDFPLFPIPTDLSSDTYRIRVSYEQSNGLMSFGSSREVSIHYFDNTNPVFIFGPNPNTSLVALCAGESVTLTVVPDTFAEYQWSYNGIPLAETSNTLENVTELGQYRVEVDFGQCNDRFEKNESTVTVVNFAPGSVTINGGISQSFCPSDDKVLSTSLSGIDGVDQLDYIWFKDDEELPGETSSTLTLPDSNFAGLYKVTVVGTNTCSVSTDPVQVFNLGSDIISRPPPEIIILPNQDTIVLEIETNADPASTIEWFVDGISQDPPVSIATPDVLEFEISMPGIYLAQIITADICNETFDIETRAYFPEGLRLEIANIISCEDNNGTLALENLYGLSGDSTDGEVPLTEEQIAFFDFVWYRDNEITNETETSIEVTDVDLGVAYYLEAALPGNIIPSVRSDDVIVEFLNNIVIEATSLILPFGGTVVLSAPFSTNYLYQWFMDGDPMPNENGSTVEVDQIGEYNVEITFSDCTLPSNTITISTETGESDLIPNIVTPNNDGINDNWLLPESLFNKEEVEIIIYNARGQVDFSAESYQNNWPLENSKSLGQEPVYYYIITKNNALVRKGSITVMR